MTQARRGFFPFVTGENVEVRQAGAMAIAARNDLRVEQGGGRIMAAGHDMSVQQGGGSVMAAGNDLSVASGGGGIVAAGNTVTMTNSIAGLAVGRTVQVGDDSKIILGSAGSLAIGALAGMALATLIRAIRSIGKE